MNIKISEIVAATGGRLLNEDTGEVATSVSTDTRTIEIGALFVPIAGPSFDGHDYIGAAAEKGAICALTERQNAPTDMDIPLIYVGSTRRALLDLAHFYRMKHDVKVVAIAGSAGKTTTKDMIAEVLSQRFKTKRTIKNFNNAIGMPLSVFRAAPGDEVLVLEMGMNHAGEVRELSLAAAPDIAVITNIGDEHMENFQNREGVLHANLEIADGLREGGTIILNGDDPLLTSEIAARKVAAFVAHYPGEKNIRLSAPGARQETRCKFHWRGADIDITVPVPGAHMVQNALLATVVGLEMGVTPAEIARAFENFKPPEGRLNIFHTRGMTVIDDVYNANPASVSEAIKVLCGNEGRRVAILGDMNELGNIAEARHREIGEFAAQNGVDLLIAIGELSRYIYEGFARAGGNGTGIHFETAADFAPDEFLKNGDTVLVKASRGMEFEKIVAKIKSAPSARWAPGTCVESGTFPRSREQFPRP
ncbi:MAG: UDP-N-acetylmuramoyl-tripeptide--D-alanyl-D-alanine ligase [Defluviitaleaceae bacterium]|nr:UDP-N-acetylmuramoyl-tripeptide--D-alanyl-D-alanine ligase [Defluviitaleaceae bacterium]